MIHRPVPAHAPGVGDHWFCRQAAMVPTPQPIDEEKVKVNFLIPEGQFVVQSAVLGKQIKPPEHSYIQEQQERWRTCHKMLLRSPAVVGTKRFFGLFVQHLGKA